ncbi:MAG: winged helix-turn-helix domain-containing protein [Candidatus Altiarchaeota archaeon]
MTDKITLDRETFKVLAADTRVEILKRIESHKKTLTDLAQEMGMSPSTIKEHLDKLVSAGLIEHVERGTKWKYYKLTYKGRGVLNPAETKVWIMLGVSLLLLGASMISLHTHLADIVSIQPLAVQQSFKAGEPKRDAPPVDGGGLLLAKSGVEAEKKAGRSRDDVPLNRMMEYEDIMAAGEVDGLDLDKKEDVAVGPAPSTTFPEVELVYDEAPRILAERRIPYVDIGIALALTMVSGACIGYLLRSRGFSG